MSCRLNHCCCFSNSQDASFASGVYTAIISVIAIIYMSINLNYASDDALVGNNVFSDRILSIVGLAIQVLFFLFSMLMLYGVRKGNRLMMIPWMVWMIIELILQFITVVMICIVFFQMLVPVILIFLVIVLAIIGLNITCFVVVNTHYQSLVSVSNIVMDEPPSYQKILISSP